MSILSPMKGMPGIFTRLKKQHFQLLLCVYPCFFGLGPEIHPFYNIFTAYLPVGEEVRHRVQLCNNYSCHHHYRNRCMVFIKNSVLLRGSRVSAVAEPILADVNNFYSDVDDPRCWNPGIMVITKVLRNSVFICPWNPGYICGRRSDNNFRRLTILASRSLSRESSCWSLPAREIGAGKHNTTGIP